ncbi:MAG TPA: DUF2064 domain-containing protein [Stellaceae bacterium]|nr:DUF2064 domain-containing protein [Stellaceae bacterium]
MSSYLILAIDYPRQTIDGRVQQLARRHGWRLLRLERGEIACRLRSSTSSSSVAIAATLPRAGHSALRAAFAALRRNDVVYGPDDGGHYWLIGRSRRRRMPRGMLRSALDDALAAMPANFCVELLPSESYPPLRL